MNRKEFMLNKVENHLAEGFEKNLFAASQANLRDKENPLRANNYAYAVRELTRHILHRKAPEENVLKCYWYSNETNKENGITRKQRAIYAIQGGLNSTYVKDTLEINTDETNARLVKAINELSKLTHIEPKVFELPEDEVDSLVKETTEALFYFVDLIERFKVAVINQLTTQIDSTLIDEVLKNTIESIDELATHHYIDEVCTEELSICEINHESVIFRAKGAISCELQWGSDSDIRKGDGATMSQSFPFSCDLVSTVNELETIKALNHSLCVETSIWYK